MPSPTTKFRATKGTQVYAGPSRAAQTMTVETDSGERIVLESGSRAFWNAVYSAAALNADVADLPKPDALTRPASFDREAS